MRKVTPIILLILFVLPAYSQVRVSKLIVKFKEVYILSQSDILVADTLIMMDSSTIVLNKLKRENYIRATTVIFGNACVIDGSGVMGKDGRDGRDGETPFGPCKEGSNGRIGARGLDGGPAVNLFLYFQDIKIKGKISINLSGGNGGRGGVGGHGGGGSPGTIHCPGGNGGNGADGGAGGNGGDGGALTLSCENCKAVEDLIGTKINIVLAGGYFGFGGRGGYNGPAGLGPSRRNGIGGKRGIDADKGKSGNRGSLKIETN